jgi:hypothetical protein
VEFGVAEALSVSEELHVSWDTAGHSVYREHATLLALEDHGTGPVVALEYWAEGCFGRRRVRTRDPIRIQESVVTRQARALEDKFLRM